MTEPAKRRAWNSTLPARTEPMPRTEWKHKGKKLNQVSPTRKVKREVARERFADCHGVYFDEVRSVAGPVASWPRVRIVDSRDVIDALKEWCMCFGCEHYGSWDETSTGLILTPHHIVGGSRGRSDELTNLMPLCVDCHRKHQSDKAYFPFLLYRKWKHDRESISWVRLCHLQGRRFDFELEVV